MRRAKSPAHRPSQKSVSASMKDVPFDRKVYHSRPTTRRLRTGPYIRHPDAELVAMTAQGDTEAYNELVERYQNAARNGAIAIVSDYQAAEDIAQDAFMKA